MDSGLSFDASEVYGREDLTLAAGWRGPGQENREVYLSSIRSFWFLETSFHAFIWMCSLIMFMVLTLTLDYIVRWQMK